MGSGELGWGGVGFGEGRGSGVGGTGVKGGVVVRDKREGGGVEGRDEEGP